MQPGSSDHVLKGGRVAETLLALLEAYSPSGREGEAVRVFRERAGLLGLDSWTDEVGNVYASTSKDGWKLALIGHIDTVPGDIEPRIQGDTVYGRGAVDAKGPLAAMMHAAAAIGNGVIVVGLVGEEDDSRGAKHLIENGIPAGYVIIGEPSGGDRVVIGYRGSLKLEVECRSRGGHSSTPWMGESALDKVLEVLDRLRTRYPGGSVFEVTVAATGLCTSMTRNVIPYEAKLLVDVRLPPGESIDAIVGEVKDIAGIDGCTPRVMDATEPVRVSVSSPVPRSLIRGLIRLGIKPRPVVKAGTSDMNLIAPYVESIAAYGPGDPSLSHTSEERITIQQLELGAHAYVHAYKELTRVSGGSTP